MSRFTTHLAIMAVLAVFVALATSPALATPIIGSAAVGDVLVAILKRGSKPT